MADFVPVEPTFFEIELKHGVCQPRRECATSRQEVPRRSQQGGLYGSRWALYQGFFGSRRSVDVAKNFVGHLQPDAAGRSRACESVRWVTPAITKNVKSPMHERPARRIAACRGEKGALD